MPAALSLASSVELVGPKGYVHGWRYVGGPGLPSVAQHNIARPRAGSLKPGDKVAALFSHHGAAGPLGSGPARKLQTHQVMSVSHTGSGASRRTHLVLRNTQTGEVRKQSLSSHARITARIAKSPGMKPMVNGKVSNQSSFRASGVGRGSPAETARARAGASHAAAPRAKTGPSPDDIVAASRTPQTKAELGAAIRKAQLSGASAAAIGRLVQRANRAIQASNSEGDSVSYDFATAAGMPPGSGANFKALTGTLAARGARNPRALAAYIGRKKYGRKGMGALSRMGHSHANEYGLAVTAKDNQGQTLTCPECGHVGSAGDFGASGARLDSSPDELRTPAPSVAGVRNGAVVNISSKSASHALSNTRRAVELAADVKGRRPIHAPTDILVNRAVDGTATLRHRQGGAVIATMRRNGEGKWIASVNGQDLTPRDHQRTALLEAVGAWNGAITAAVRPQAAPLNPAPVQTPLMERFGIPAERAAAFATPVAGVSDGPRATSSSAGGDSGTDDNGLNARGQAIYKRLLAKGFPSARALAFAKNAQRKMAGS